MERLGGEREERSIFRSVQSSAVAAAKRAVRVSFVRFGRLSCGSACILHDMVTVIDLRARPGPPKSLPCNLPRMRHGSTPNGREEFRATGELSPPQPYSILLAREASLQSRLRDLSFSSPSPHTILGLTLDTITYLLGALCESLSTDVAVHRSSTLQACCWHRPPPPAYCLLYLRATPTSYNACDRLAVDTSSAGPRQPRRAAGGGPTSAGQPLGSPAHH